MHHDFPLPMHSHSREAARWANAAAAIGKFEQVEAVLYSQQETWGASGDIEKALSASVDARGTEAVQRAGKQSGN